MSTWVNIVASRMAASALWPAELTLDFMGEDWATFTVPLDCEFNETIGFSFGDSGVTTKTLGLLCLGFPDSWDSDDEFVASLRLSLVIPWTVGGPNTHEASLGVNGGTFVVLNGGGGGASGVATITRTWDEGALPTGPTTITVEARADVDFDPGESFNVQSTRTMGSRGPDCRYQFVLSSAA